MAIRVVIVGGGLSGWTAAAGLANAMEGLQASITVIEHGAPSTHRAAQFLLPQTLPFFRHLRFDISELIGKTAATYRLGTELLDVESASSRRFRPFGAAGAPIGFIPFHHFVTRARLAGEEIALSDFSANTIAAAMGRLQPLEGSEAKKLVIDYGLNFDAAKLAALLRQRALAAGVTELKGSVRGMVMHNDTGDFESVEIDEKRSVPGDLFLDCTGEEGLLSIVAEDNKFADWADWFPCEHELHVTTPAEATIPLFTRRKATAAGFISCVPLQDRLCWRYAWQRGVQDERAAVQDVVQMAGAEPAELYVRRRRAAGRLQNAWSRNRIAIGAAAVSTEVFDVSEFHAVQSAILRLARMLPASTSAPETAAAYNREAALEDEILRDHALIDRYAVCAARGAGFSPPDSLQRRIDLFVSGGRFVGDVDPVFAKSDWANAFASVGILPAACDPLLEAMPQDELVAHFSRMREAMQQAIGGMPSHAELLARLGAPA